jgi:hypothetical protein
MSRKLTIKAVVEGIEELEDTLRDTLETVIQIQKTRKFKGDNQHFLEQCYNLLGTARNALEEARIYIQDIKEQTRSAN